MLKQFSIQTSRRTEFVEITPHVQRALADAGNSMNSALVYVPHTTAGVMINEHADPDVARDLERRLDEMVPWDNPKDRHSEGNTAAHLKAALMGASARVIVENGRLKLGTWQGIFFCEFDGPRTRQIWVSFDG